MPPSKLYKVTVSFSLYVLASDIDDAQGVATRNASRELANRGAYESIAEVAEVTDRRSIAPGWLESQPYGTPGTRFGDMDCGQALAAIIAERRRADLPDQGELFGEAR